MHNFHEKNYISDEQIPIMQIRVTCVTPSAKNQWTSWIWEVNFKNLLDCTFAINLASKCIFVNHIRVGERDKNTKIWKYQKDKICSKWQFEEEEE